MRTLLLTALLSAGCARALRPVPGSDPPRYEGRVAFELPSGWDLSRRRRFFGNQAFTLKAPEPSSAVTVRVMREGRVSRALPLPVVAEALSVDAGRSLGVESALVGLQQVELDGREAWAATVRRRHGPVERVESSVYLRAGRDLVVVSLHTVSDAPAAVLTAWSSLLGSLSLPMDPRPDTPPFAWDAAMEAELDAWEAPP
ncbi:MAG: hypothetical protein H6741_22680 [Alphaproteobacteria bacterium]|nr:hypothetical protein [Alphaproteobacteria bacterium]